MRCYWLLLLSFLGAVFVSSPAQAARFLSWRLESNQNQLIFTTDKGVQPKAKLIQNPTRLVIDLPGTTLGRPSINQSSRGSIKNVRIGQLDEKTTRIVLELASGYTIDPLQVKIQGLSDTKWMVNIPTPEKVATSKANLLSNNQNTSEDNTKNNTSEDFQITQNGLLVSLESQQAKKILVRRSIDRRQINIELTGAKLPDSLISNSLPVDNYGVEQIRFWQTSNSPPMARITLNVSEDSPDWDASFSKVGALVLQQRVNKDVRPARISSRDISSQTRLIGKDVRPARISPRDISSQTRLIGKQATIESVELDSDNNQLLIQADQKVIAQTKWNSNTRLYEIRITNAQLPKDFQNPNLGNNRSISRLRIRQEDAQTVVVMLQPGIGVRLDQLKQNDANLVALQIQDITKIRNSIEAPLLPPLNNQAVTQTPTDYVSNTPLERAWQRISSTRNKQEKILVIIDPGHGGQDPGAKGINGILEKDVVLPISQQVAALLQKQGIQVKMTRDTDYFVSLQYRAEMSNKADASLFVSIHANSMGMGRPDINGLETYYYGGGRDFAQTIHKNILQRVNIDNRGVRRARFFVLRKTAMPAVLVETGFVTGREDAPKLANPEYRQKMAEAIASGIIEYIKRHKL